MGQPRPKPIPDQAGNGAHLHASLWEAGPDGQPGGRNVLHDAGDPRGLSELAYHWIAGLLAHLPALVALTCASVNSYRRLVPQSWSSAFTCWGMGNREAAVRVPSRMWGLEEASANLQLKPSDATGNPYLALGPLRRTAYLAVKRSEVATFGTHDTAFECFHPFTKF